MEHATAGLAENETSTTADHQTPELAFCIVVSQTAARSFSVTMKRDKVPAALYSVHITLRPIKITYILLLLLPTP
jgi:hypothetical protein